MFELPKFDVTRANEYRYTLIYKRMCYDFIVRDGQIYFLTEASKFEVFDPRLKSTKLIRIKCEFWNGTFTHFIFRTKPYFDKLGVGVEGKLVVIQDRTKEHNLTINFEPLPLYYDIEEFFEFDKDEINISNLIPSIYGK